MSNIHQKSSLIGRRWRHRIFMVCKVGKRDFSFPISPMLNVYVAGKYSKSVPPGDFLTYLLLTLLVGPEITLRL